jgi:hypothetical protein
MNFVAATSKLIDDITLGDLAKEMGFSRGFLGQSRLDPRNPQHRKPPPGWQAAVAKLASRRAEELSRLVAQLAGASQGVARKARSRRAGRPVRRGRSRARR